MPFIWAAVLLLNAVLLFGAHGTEREEAHIAQEVLRTARASEGGTAFDKVTAARLSYLEEYKKTHEKIEQTVKDGFTAANERASYVDAYQNTVKNRIEESERALKSGFYRTGSAEWTSLQAGLRDQKAYLDYEPALMSVKWLEILLSYLWVPVLLLGMLILTVLVFFNASERGLRPVLFASKNGRQGLFFRRIVLLVFEAFFGAFLLYGEAAAVLIYIYGGAESLSAPAISVERLLFNAGDLTMLQYLLSVALFSAAGCLMLSLFAWVAGSFVENRTAALLLFIVFFGIEFLLYSLISSKTVFRFLHYLNIYPLLFPMEALSREYWGYDIGVQLKSVSILLTGAVLSIGAVVLLLKKSRAYEAGKRWTVPWLQKIRTKWLKNAAAFPVFFK